MIKGKNISADPELLKMLRQEVENRFGAPLHSPRDFSRLCDAIEEEFNQPISLSTIKRLWGYVKCDYEPRLSTLSLLSRYVGYTDWLDFVESTKHADSNQSGFMSGRSIVADEISVGDEVIFTWAPNRRCHVRYLGCHCFKVLSSRNTKIEENDTFNTALFAVGHPMYATNVVKANGETHNVYIAGKEQGLSSVVVRNQGAPGYTPVK